MTSQNPLPLGSFSTAAHPISQQAGSQLAPTLYLPSTPFSSNDPRSNQSSAQNEDGDDDSSMEDDDEDGTTGPSTTDTKKDSAAPFMRTVNTLMIDPALKSIIGWNADGDAVVVLNIAEFVRVALPRYFRAKQFESIAHQFNSHGFSRTGTNTSDNGVQSTEFKNPIFKRGMLDFEIITRKPSGISSSSTAGSSLGPQATPRVSNVPPTLRKPKTQLDDIQQQVEAMKRQLARMNLEARRPSGRDERVDTLISVMRSVIPDFDARFTKAQAINSLPGTNAPDPRHHSLLAHSNVYDQNISGAVNGGSSGTSTSAMISSPHLDNGPTLLPNPLDTSASGIGVQPNLPPLDLFDDVLLSWLQNIMPTPSVYPLDHSNAPSPFRDNGTRSDASTFHHHAPAPLTADETAHNQAGPSSMDFLAHVPGTMGEVPHSDSFDEMNFDRA